MCCHITLYKTGGASGGCTRKPPVCGLQAHNTWMDSGGFFFIISVDLKLEYKTRKDQGDRAVHSTQLATCFQSHLNAASPFGEVLPLQQAFPQNKSDI